MPTPRRLLVALPPGPQAPPSSRTTSTPAPPSSPRVFSPWTSSQATLRCASTGRAPTGRVLSCRRHRLRHWPPRGACRAAAPAWSAPERPPQHLTSAASGAAMLQALAQAARRPLPARGHSRRLNVTPRPAASQAPLMCCCWQHRCRAKAHRLGSAGRPGTSAAAAIPALRRCRRRPGSRRQSRPAARPRLAPPQRQPSGRSSAGAQLPSPCPPSLGSCSSGGCSLDGGLPGLPALRDRCLRACASAAAWRRMLGLGQRNPTLTRLPYFLPLPAPQLHASPAAAAAPHL